MICHESYLQDEFYVSLPKILSAYGELIWEYFKLMSFTMSYALFSQISWLKAYMCITHHVLCYVQIKYDYEW